MKRSRAKMEGYLSITIRGYVFGAIAKCKASPFSKRDYEECIGVTCSNEQGRYLCFGFHLAS